MHSAAIARRKANAAKIAKLPRDILLLAEARNNLGVLSMSPMHDAAIADGSFFARPALIDACRRALETGRLHAVGLIGPGGVHAHDRHLLALVELAARMGVPSVRVHALLDGRDTPPSSALGFMRDLEAGLAAAASTS